MEALALQNEKFALTACILDIVTALNAMPHDNKPWRSAIA